MSRGYDWKSLVKNVYQICDFWIVCWIVSLCSLIICFHYMSMEYSTKDWRHD